MSYEEARELVERLVKQAGKNISEVSVGYDTIAGLCFRIRIKGRWVGALTLPWLDDDKKLAALCHAAGWRIPGEPNQVSLSDG